MSRRSLSQSYSTAGSQRGAVLFIALTFLLILSLLAVAASSTSLLQERMTGGMRDAQLGLMGAESTLRGSEFELWNLSETAKYSAGGLPKYCGFDGLVDSCYSRTYGKTNSKVQRFRATTGATTSPALGGSKTYAAKLDGLTGTEETASLAAKPSYLMEDIGAASAGGTGQMEGAINPKGGASDPEDLRLYRITARSNGGSTNVVRVTESTYLALIPKSFSAK
jgi:type IV pilus assembly protein PilX